MVIPGLTVGQLTHAAISTMACLGGKVLRAIKCNEQRMVQNAQWL